MMETHRSFLSLWNKDVLWYEWIDNLALRRVYFLESDHYPMRVQELDDITAVLDIAEGKKKGMPGLFIVDSHRFTGTNTNDSHPHHS